MGGMKWLMRCGTDDLTVKVASQWTYWILVWFGKSAKPKQYITYGIRYTVYSHDTTRVSLCEAMDQKEGYANLQESRTKSLTHWYTKDNIGEFVCLF